MQDLVVIALSLAVVGLLAALQMYRKYFPRTMLSSGAKTVEETRVAIPQKLAEQKKETVEPTEEWRCTLRVVVQVAGHDAHTHEWTNTTWDNVARRFFSWYIGRPKSKLFVMDSRDSVNKRPMKTIILRKNISRVETHWTKIVDHKGKKDGN